MRLCEDAGVHAVEEVVDGLGHDVVEGVDRLPALQPFGLGLQEWVLDHVRIRLFMVGRLDLAHLVRNRLPGDPAVQSYHAGADLDARALVALCR